MGWSHGGDAFGRVTRKLVELRAPDRVLTAVCADLIDALRDADWDTLDESIEEFRENRAVMAAFRLAAPEWVTEEKDQIMAMGEDGNPAYPEPGSSIPSQPSYVVGECGHRVASSEWRAGFRTCERCPDNKKE